MHFDEVKDFRLFFRINQISFENFRNIEQGTIDFPNSKPIDFLNEAPSVLGLYGQNGSGKTSIIMAISILKNVLSGNALEDGFESCIRDGCERCTLSFILSSYYFDYKKPMYEFEIKKKESLEFIREICTVE